MKRFFTLIAGLLLVSSGAFAQEKWKTINTNPTMEGEQDPLWSSYWCHDWRLNVEFNPESNQKYDEKSATEVSPGQFQGFAEIIEDPVKPGNHCARVIIRSKEEADAAGNPTTDSGNNKPDWTEWDSQFFIYATETIPEGKELRLTMKVRGEKNGTMQTQAHYEPGNYNHYQLFGDIEYTTEWKKIEVTATVTSSHTQESNGKFFQSVAFNLSTMRDGNVVYFDDVRLQVRDPQEAQPDDDSGWFNFLPKGTLSEMELNLANGKFTNFTSREGAVGKDLPAKVIDVDGVPTLTLQSIGYNATDESTKQIEATDPETGETLKDEEGNTIMKDTVIVTKIYIRENGDTVKKNDGSLGVEDWATQFFVSSPHKFQKGEKMVVRFKYRADKEATVATQLHNGPGAYVAHGLLGNLNFTDEWQVFNDTVTVNNSGTTIAFNCNALKEVNNYYFQFDEFSVGKSFVTIDDRTLKREDLKLPVPDAENEVNIKLDMTPMIETLGIDNLTDFLNENAMRVLVREIIPGEEPGEDPEIKESISGGMQPTTGIFINAYGSYVDEEEGINITFPEEGIEGNIATLNVFNLNGAVKAGEPIDTKLCFESDEWFYTYDVTFITPAEYEDAMGISVLKSDKKFSGAIYDLTGRKVNKAVKGLYIKDGKKFFIK